MRSKYPHDLRTPGEALRMSSTQVAGSNTLHHHLTNVRAALKYEFVACMCGLPAHVTLYTLNAPKTINSGDCMPWKYTCVNIYYITPSSGEILCNSLQCYGDLETDHTWINLRQVSKQVCGFHVVDYASAEPRSHKSD